MIYRKIDISKAAFYNVSEDVAKEFIDHRIDCKKSPLTQGAFDRAMKNALKCEHYGMTPDQAIEETIDADWKGVTPAYIAARWSRKMKALQEASAGGTRGNTLIEDLTDRSWAH